jgi:hypothetical protein
MLSTDDLRRRPSRPPDYSAENQALIALAQEMASSPEDILQKLANTALSLCRAHSAGLSVLEDGDQRSNFHWRAIAGQWTPHINGGTPRNFGPCGTVLDQNVAMVCSHPEPIGHLPGLGERHRPTTLCRSVLSVACAVLVGMQIPNAQQSAESYEPWPPHNFICTDATECWTDCDAKLWRYRGDIQTPLPNGLRIG